MKKKGAFILSLALLSSTLLTSCDNVKNVISTKFGVLIQGASDLYKGKTLQLSALNSSEDDELVWTSSDENVATVSDSGLVTGVNEGSVTIKCSSKKYDYSYDEVTIKVIDSTKIVYKVVFKDYDGTVLEEDSVHPGEFAYYNGKEPTRLSSDMKNYTFLGWDKDLDSPINSDTVFVAQYGETDINFKEYAFYLFTSGDYAGKYVVKYSGSEKEVTLPTSYNYREVVGVYDGSFKNNTTVEKINIPDEYVYFGNKAFYGCTNLRHINFPSKLIYLGQYAFALCTSLISAALPDTVTVIQPYAFLNCSSLVSVKMSDNVTTIGNYAFSGCTNLVMNSLPSKVENLLNSAFNKCAKFTGDIVLPSTVKKVEAYVFSGTGLTGLTINKDLEDFASNAILGSNNLLTLKVDPENEHFKAVDDVLYSKDGTALYAVAPAFTHDLNVLEGVETIKSFSATNSKAQKIVLPKSLTLIESNAFWGNSAKEIVFNKEMDGSKLTMEEYAFSESLGITRFEVPYGVSKIPSYFLYESRNLTELIIPETVYSIGECAFSDTGITEFTIPESFRVISERLLDGTNVKEIIIPKNVERIETYAFSDLPELTKVTFVNPQKITFMDYGVFNGSKKLKEIVGDFPLLTEAKDNNFDYIGLPFGTFTDTAIENFKLPDGFQLIDNFAFKNCTSLKDIYLPASLKRIQEWVFENTGLEHIYFGGTKEEFALLLTKVDSYDVSPVGTVYDDNDDVPEENKSYNILKRLYDEDKITYNAKYSEVDFSKTETTK